jgi:hypothetical protein
MVAAIVAEKGFGVAVGVVVAVVETISRVAAAVATVFPMTARDAKF